MIKSIYQIIFIAILFSAYHCNAQATNDDCLTARSIGVLDGTYDFVSWDFNLYDTCVDISTQSATTSYPYYFTDSTCGIYPSDFLRRDVWFKFTANNAFAIRGTKPQFATTIKDSVSITFWQGSQCDSLRAVGNYEYVISAVKPFFYDTIWTAPTNSADTFYAQVSSFRYSGNVDLYLCFRGINANTPPIVNCHFSNANTKTICFKYKIEKTDAYSGSNGTAKAVVQQGRGPFSFLWNDSNTDSSRNNLSPGMYYVTITDNAGCSITDSITIAASCSAVVTINKKAPAKYSFIATSIDTTYNKHFVWIINGDTITQDSTATSIDYLFTNDSIYLICLSLFDSVNTCAFDTCILLSITNTSYVPLLNTTNIWHYAPNMVGVKPNIEFDEFRSSLCGSSVWYSMINHTEYTGADTIFNGKSYRILFSQTLNSFPMEECVMGYLREDLLQRKVYYWEEGGLDEYLLYDFGMNVGDSIYIHFPTQQSIYTSGFYYLDSIAPFTTLQTVSPRREFFLKKQNQPYLKWVEGIGNLVSMVYVYGAFIQFGGGPFYCPEFQDPGTLKILTCYEHSQLEYFNACALSIAMNGGCIYYEDSCNYYNICGGINDLSSSLSLSVYPNPSVGKLTLDLDVFESGGDYSIRILDFIGRPTGIEINLGHLQEGEHKKEIDISNLLKGIYLVECFSKTGSAFSKLIVQ